MASESGLYPPGAEHDPRAPWNQPEPVACPDCDGRGWVSSEGGGKITETPHGHYVEPAAVKCERCEGEGYVNPPEDEGPDPDDLRDAELDRRMNGDE